MSRTRFEQVSRGSRERRCGYHGDGRVTGCRPAEPREKGEGHRLAARMEQQAKGQSAKKSAAGRAAPEPVASEEELNLQREYDGLTDTLNDLRRKADALRRENELLREEANRTRTESQEYVDYMARKMENRQRAAAALSRHNEEELRRLRKEGEATLKRYTKQANELKEGILQKEQQLLSLNAEIAELMEFKNLQQEQLGRIAELQNEVLATHLSHSQSLQALKTGFLSDKERYEAQAKQKVHALTLAANREAPSCLICHAQELTQENQQLRDELRRLIRQAQALRTQHNRLQEQRQQLLLDREHMLRVRGLVTEPAGTPPP